MKNHHLKSEAAGLVGPAAKRKKEGGASVEPSPSWAKPSVSGGNPGFPQIDFAVGGQALIEGVMIRAPSWITIAVRKPDNEIIVKKDRFISLAKRYKLLGLPVLRGIIMLFETIILGMRALNFSAEISLEEGSGIGDQGSVEREKGTKKGKIVAALSFAASIIFSLALAIFLFKFVPLFITEKLREIWPTLANSTLLFNLTDGFLRISIFFLYIFILSRFTAFQRVFQYHGAEHKSIFAYEKGSPLTPEHVKPESPRHPRCGTSFIIIVLIVSILLFSLVPRHPVFWISFLRRLAILPLIMGIGYEVLKWTAKFQHRTFIKWLTYPGIATQYITTKEPDEAQIEVALAALKAAVDLEKLHAPQSN